MSDLSQHYFMDNFDSPLVKKRGRKSTGTSASKGKNRRQTIDHGDLENFQNISELSVSFNSGGKKRNDRRETIDPHDLLALGDSSVLSSKSGSSADPLDLQKAVLNELSMSTTNVTPSMTLRSRVSQMQGDLSVKSHRTVDNLLPSPLLAHNNLADPTETTPFSFNGSNKKTSKSANKKVVDRRQTIDQCELANLLDLDFSEHKDEDKEEVEKEQNLQNSTATATGLLSSSFSSSFTGGLGGKDRRRETIDPIDLLNFSTSSSTGAASNRSGDSVMIEVTETFNKSLPNNFTPSSDLLTGLQQVEEKTSAKKTAKSTGKKNKKTPNRRETIDVADLLNLNESSLLSNRSTSTIDPTDVQHILDDIEATSPGTVVTMTGISMLDGLDESDRSLLPLENFLKIGSPGRAPEESKVEITECFKASSVSAKSDILSPKVLDLLLDNVPPAITSALASMPVDNLIHYEDNTTDSKSSKSSSAKKGKGKGKKSANTSDLLDFSVASSVSSVAPSQARNDRRDTIDAADLQSFINTSTLSMISSTTSPEEVQREGDKNERRETIDPMDLRAFIDTSNNTAVLSSSLLDTSATIELTKNPTIEAMSADSPAVDKKKRGRKSTGSSGKKAKTRKTSLRKTSKQDTSSSSLFADDDTSGVALTRRETIDPTDFRTLADTSLLSNRSTSTIDPTDVQHILDDIEAASPGTVVTMTGISMLDGLDESDRSLLPLENFLKIGSPVRTLNDTTAPTSAHPVTSSALPILSSALKSCLSSRKPPRDQRDFNFPPTASKSVVFGSPQVAEFHKTSPTTKFTPMEKSQAKALFHKGIEEEEAEEELDEVTAENERILEEWDRLTQASEGSPQQSIEDDFPFEDFSNDDANGSSSQLQLNSTLSSVKRRQSMLQPRIDSLPVANTSAVSSSVEDSNTNEAEEEFTATVQLPSTLSALMEEVSMEQKKRRNDQENEEEEGDRAEEYDDHTEAIETDLRSLLHHIDEKHSFLDLRGDSSASHLSTSTSHHQSAIAAGVMDFEVFEDNESSKVADAHDVMEGGKSPRQSIMSEIFPMAGNQSSSNLMDISSTAQLDDDLHHLYQHPASNVAPSNTPSHTSSAYTSEHSILSHLGGAEEAILMTSTIAPSEHSSSSKKIRRALESKSIQIFEDAGIEDKEEQEVGEEVQMEEEDDDVSGLSEEQDEAEGEEEEEEEEESLSFIGKKAKLLLEEIQTPPHTATHPAAHTAATAVKVIEGSQLTGLRQRLLNLKATVSTEAAPSTSAPPLSMQVEQVVEKVEQRRKSSATTSIPTAMKTPFSSRKSISANNKNTSEKKKKTTPKAMPMPTPAKATTTPITTTSEVVLPAVAQPTSEEWDMLIFAQWSKVVAVVEKMTSLTKTMSAHPRYTTIATYIHATVEENLCSATRFLRQLSAFLTSQLSLLWQHYMTAPRSTSSDYSLLYREELAITSSSAYSELVGSLTSSESGRGEYYLLRHQSAQWEEMWLELINSSLFEGIAQLKRQRHSISSTSATSSTSTDRFLSKALNIAPPPTPGVEVSVTSSSKALLQEVIEGNEEQRRQQTTLQQRVKEMAMQSSILNRFSFFRILSLLSNVIEVQVLLSDEAKIILHFHLRPGGKEEVHRVDGLDIDLSFSDTIRTTERSLISTYFAEVMTTEKWHGPLNPNDLQRLDKISEIPALLERVSGYVLALRAGLTMVKKIEEVYGSVKILRDSLLPSVYIEYEHSAYPVMMSLVSFLNYALEKSHLFIPSKDSIVMLLEDLRGLRRQTNTNTNTNSSSSHPFSSP